MSYLSKKNYLQPCQARFSLSGPSSILEMTEKCMAKNKGPYGAELGQS